MAYYHDTAANVADLAGLFGFEPLAARAWLRCEAQGVDNPTNPLNILAGGHTSRMQTGTSGRFARFASAHAGLRAAHLIVADLAPRYGYQAILDQHGSGDPLAQVRAVERSSWAGGNYGSTATRDGCLARYVRANGGSDVQLTDQVKLPGWVPEAWPASSGLQDGKIAVQSALGSTYGHARKANEQSRALLVQLAALQATVDQLVAHLATGAGLDPAQLQAAVQQGVQDALAKLQVDVSLSDT